MRVLINTLLIVHCYIHCDFHCFKNEYTRL
nr:MAG TPA: YABBY protein [Caudoviricetes sp.]